MRRGMARVCQSRDAWHPPPRRQRLPPAIRPLLLLVLAFLALCGNLQPVQSASVLLSRRRHGQPKLPHEGSKDRSTVARFVHITDLHLDAHYADTAGADTLCHERPNGLAPKAPRPFVEDWRKQQHVFQDGTVPIASVLRSGEADPPPVRARWGRRGSACDSPLRLVALAAQFLANPDLDLDYVLWTGDSARHDRDPQLVRTEFEIYDSNERCARMIAAAIRPPTADHDGDDEEAENDEFKAFPTIGNLDVFPHNLLDPPSNSTLLPQLAKSLRPVLPPDTLTTASFTANGTFHQVLHGGALHAVSVNTMYFMKENTWARGDCDNPESPGAMQISWLNATLTRIPAEYGPKARAMILGHVPPSSSTGGNSDDSNPQTVPVLPSNYKPACATQYLATLAMHAAVVVSMHSGHVNNDATMFVSRVHNVTTGETAVAVVDVGDFARRAEAVDDTTQGGLGEIQFLVPLYCAPSVIPVNNPAIRVMEYDLVEARWARWTQYFFDIGAATEVDNAMLALSRRFAPASSRLAPVIGSNGINVQDDFSDQSELTTTRPDLDTDKKKKKKKKKKRKHPPKIPHHPRERWPKCDPTRPGFCYEYATDLDHHLPFLTVHEWRKAALGTLDMPPEPIEDPIKAMRGSGGRRGAAREFRQRYRYYFTVQGQYDDEDLVLD